MRKISLLLAGAAGLAVVAGAVASPALAQVSFGIDIGPPSYHQPYRGRHGYNSYRYNSYGYNTRPFYAPYYGYNQPYTYGNPNYYQYNRNHDYPGYYSR